MKLKLNSKWSFEELFPKISAYTTAYNCISGGFPMEDVLKSWAWVDELIVVDGGSDDGTREELKELSKKIPSLVVYDIPIDWGMPSWDGAQKAMARAMCMNEVCIQFDLDEACLGSIDKWKRLVKDLDCDILELPVLEPYGDITKLRLNPEHNPVKWRISKNKSEITHGIPKQDQKEIDGKKFSRGGSDGCNYIHIVTENPYPSRLNKSAQKVRELYSKKEWGEYKKTIENLLKQNEPMVLHLGHVNLTNKIKLFLKTWRFGWAKLYNKDPNDLSMFWPGRKLKAGELVSDTEIKSKVKELKERIESIEIKKLGEYR